MYQFHEQTKKKHNTETSSDWLAYCLNCVNINLNNTTLICQAPNVPKNEVVCRGQMGITSSSDKSICWHHRWTAWKYSTNSESWPCYTVYCPLITNVYNQPVSCIKSYLNQNHLVSLLLSDILFQPSNCIAVDWSICLSCHNISGL